MKFGLIAGNGKFPFMVVEGRTQSGAQVVAARSAKRPIRRLNNLPSASTWIGIGQLGEDDSVSSKTKASRRRSWQGR